MLTLSHKIRNWWRRSRRVRRIFARVLVVGMALARLVEYALRYFSRGLS